MSRHAFHWSRPLPRPPSRPNSCDNPQPPPRAFPWSHSRPNSGECPQTPVRDVTTNTIASLSTERFFYPPLSKASTPQPQPQPPHPYQIAGAGHANSDTNSEHVQDSVQTSHFLKSTTVHNEKVSTSSTQHQLLLQVPVPILRQRQRSLPPSPIFFQNTSPLKNLIPFLILLPIPPLLSIIYLLTGQAIFRNHPHFHHPHTPTFIYAQIGATGGIILSIPFALFIYLITILLSPRDTTDREDFFDDDSDGGYFTQTQYSVGVAIYVLFFLVLGAAAGPLGLACLRDSRNGGIALTPSQASSEGIVGGLVFFLSLVALFTMIVLAVPWVKRIRRPTPPPMEETPA